MNGDDYPGGIRDAVMLRAMLRELPDVPDPAIVDSDDALPINIPIRDTIDRVMTPRVGEWRWRRTKVRV